MRAAGMALGGGTAALGLSSAASATSEGAAAGSSAVMSAARVRGYSALTEAVAGLRSAGSVGKAAGKLTEWYAAASPGERIEIDGALDAIIAMPGTFSALTVGKRLDLLAKELAGPRQAKITAAIGLVLAGLRESSSAPVNAQAAGRLYARTIRALPAQPKRASTPAKPAKARTGPGCGEKPG